MPGPHVPVDLDVAALRRQVEAALDRRLGKGALIVLTADRQVAHEVRAISQLIWVRSPNACDQLSETHKETVRRHRAGTGYVCAAIYRGLDPDDYMVWSDANHPTSVPVFPNEATLVDWR